MQKVVDVDVDLKPTDIELAEISTSTITNTAKNISEVELRPSSLPSPKTEPSKTQPIRRHPGLVSGIGNKGDSGSFHTLRLRIQQHEEKLKKLEMNLKIRGKKPWKRTFYCSEYCRIKSLLFIGDSQSSFGAGIYLVLLIITIILSYGMALTETLRDTAAADAPYLRGNLQPNKYLNIQLVFVTIFAIDTFLRFLLADSWFGQIKETDGHRLLDPLRVLSRKPFFLDFWNYVDIISIAMVFVVGFSASFFIVLRIFRPVKNLAAFKIIIDTMRESFSLLTVSTFFLISVIVVFAFVILAFESCYNNDCQFVDGFSSAYFVVITMTSVGFGDQIPTTAASRVVAMLVMIIGSFYLAMPLAIVGAQFDKAWEEQEKLHKAKRSPEENILLEQIREKKLTVHERRERVVVLSYQILDNLNSLMGNMRLLAYDQSRAKIKVANSFEKTFKLIGHMLDELLILFPTYPISSRPKYVMINQNHDLGRVKRLKSLGSSTELDSKVLADIVDDIEKGSNFGRKKALSISSASSTGRKRFMKKNSFKTAAKSVSFGLKKDNIEKRDSDANISDVLTSLKIAASVDEREVEIKKIDDAMRGVSFLKTQVDVKTGTLRIVELSDTHTPDGIALKGHYWAGQQTKHPRDMSMTELLKKYREAQVRRSDVPSTFLLAFQRCTDCLFDSVHVNIELVQYNADNGCLKSKVWLILEAPESSPAAYWTRNVRLALTFFALMLVFIETTPEFNNYGPNSRHCKASVNQYCNWISTCVGEVDAFGDSQCRNLWSKTSYSQKDVDTLNPGCFPNVTSGYKGCVGVMTGKYSECDFPNEKVGMTMDKDVFGNKFLDYLGKSDTSKYKIKDRMQCQENVGSDIDYGTTFWSLELIFTIIFTVELFFRLVVATIPEDLIWFDWLSDFGNIIDILAVCTALVEFIGNTVDFGSESYTVWGWMWSHTGDPMTFRFLRLVVAVRFMLQQRHFKSTQIITSTILEVMNRLTAPLLMFGILVTMFGSLLFIVEGGLLYKCTDFSTPTKETCSYCGGPPFLVPFGTGINSYFYANNGGTNNKNFTSIDVIDWTDPWLGHQEWYNGTCRFLHLAPGGAVSGVGAGKVLQTPLIIDAYDGVWTIFVVMTTVGYGGKRPHTPLGKLIVATAAIFGAFYLAMPLSIIATAFNKKYQVHLEVEEKEQKRRERQQLTFGGGKLKFMHIVKLKLWAKRAVSRAQGHHYLHDPPGLQVSRYSEAVHNLANKHYYSDVKKFKEIHKALIENCVAMVARHIKYSR